MSDIIESLNNAVNAVIRANYGKASIIVIHPADWKKIVTNTMPIHTESMQFRGLELFRSMDVKEGHPIVA